MKDLFQSLYGQFAATSGTPPVNTAIYNDLGGQLFNTFAPQGTNYPFAVFQLVSDVPDWTFSDDEENIIVQFNIFDNSESSLNICNYFSDLDAIYHQAILTLTDYECIYCFRELSHLLRDNETEGGIWQYMVQYRILLQKN